MRTTIEITDEQRAQLLRLAAQRGEKGFSAIVQLALDRYLHAEASREELVGAARGLKGTLKAKDADALGERVGVIRERWR